MGTLGSSELTNNSALRVGTRLLFGQVNRQFYYAQPFNGLTSKILYFSRIQKPSVLYPMMKTYFHRSRKETYDWEKYVLATSYSIQQTLFFYSLITFLYLHYLIHNSLSLHTILYTRICCIHHLYIKISNFSSFQILNISLERARVSGVSVLYIIHEYNDFHAIYFNCAHSF